MAKTELDLSGLTEENRTYLVLLQQSGQKPKHATTLFGKPYLWFEDPETGKVYLERLHYEDGTGS